MAGDPKPVVTGYPAAPPPPIYGAMSSAPYAGPPPSSYAAAMAQPVYYPTPAVTPNSRALFLRRLLIILVAAIVAAGAVTLIAWLVLRPRLPVFSVSSASLSSFNASSSQVSSNLSVSLAVQNPNHKMSVHYDNVWASALYDLNMISEAALPPFDQETENSREITARLFSVGEYVEGDVAGKMEGERRSQGAVGFQVRVLAWVRFSAGAWRTRRYVMRVFCDGVRIGFGNATTNHGSLVGGPKPCEVNL